MRLLKVNSADMLRNGSREPELLGMFGARAPPITLVSSGQSTARHLFIKDCSAADCNGLAASDEATQLQLSACAQNWEPRTRVVGQLWRVGASNNSGFQRSIHSKTSFHSRLFWSRWSQAGDIRCVAAARALGFAVKAKPILLSRPKRKIRPIRSA